MTTDVKTDLDFNNNQVINVIAHKVSTLPAAVAGKFVYYNNTIYVSDGTNWKSTGVQIATDAQATTGTAEDVAINPKQLAVKANLDSPAFTGTPTAPTASAGSESTQIANTAFVANAIAVAVQNAMVYKGTWDTTNQTDFSGLNSYRPIKAGWLFKCTGTGCIIDGVEYKSGDTIVFNSPVASGVTITSAMLDKFDNTESDDIVRLDLSQTLTNKSIDADDNSISDLTTSNFKSGEVISSVTQNSGKLITSGGVYDELQNYQTSLTFSTGLTNTSGTVTVDYPFIALSEGSLAVGGSGGTLTELSAGTNNYVLTMVSGVPAWAPSRSIIKKETYTNPSLTPSSGVCTWTIAHGLNSTDFTVRVYEVSTGQDVFMDITATGNSNVVIQFNESSNVAAGTYKAVLVG